VYIAIFNYAKFKIHSIPSLNVLLHYLVKYLTAFDLQYPICATVQHNIIKVLLRYKSGTTAMNSLFFFESLLWPRHAVTDSNNGVRLIFFAFLFSAPCTCHPSFHWRICHMPSVSLRRLKFGRAISCGRGGCKSWASFRVKWLTVKGKEFT